MTIQQITEIVAQANDLTLDQVRTKARTRPGVEVRQQAMVIGSMYGHSHETIAAYFEKDHSTVSHAKKKIGGYCETSKRYTQHMNHLIAMVASYDTSDNTIRLNQQAAKYIQIRGDRAFLEGVRVGSSMGERLQESGDEIVVNRRVG